MTKDEIFRWGQDYVDRGDYFQGLQCFLDLRNLKLDRLAARRVGRSATRIRLRDVNSDTTAEVGLISEDNKVVILTLHPDMRVLARLEDMPYANFRFFQRESNMALLVSGKYKNANVLSVHDFRFSGAGWKLVNVGELTPSLGHEVISDIAYKRRRIYVATADRQLHVFNDVTFRQEGTLKTTAAVRELNTGGRPPAKSQNWRMDNLLLAILEDGGLAFFDVSRGEEKELEKFGAGTYYTSTFVTDVDGDGVDEILACSLNGKLHIYDWYSHKLKYQITYPDEFYIVYCHDIDGDGVPEILVGAKSNHIYAFAIDPNRNLSIKWKYRTDHRVWDLWVGNVQQGADKRLLARLANGTLQVFKIPPPQEINRAISEAFRRLRDSLPPDELHQRFCQSEHPQVIRYGLEELLPEMNCSEALACLKKIASRDELDPSLQMLPRLGMFFGKCQSDPSLIEHILDFIKNTFERKPDLPTCELIYSALDKAVSEGGAAASEKVAQLADYFRGELLRRQGIPPLRGERAVKLAGAGDLAAADRELETLKIVGVDLLRSLNTADGVTDICAIENGQRIAFTTKDHTVNLIDRQLQNPPLTRPLGGAGLICRPVAHADFAYIVCYGAVVEVFDHHDHAIRKTLYDRQIISGETICHQGEVYWAVGLDDGRLIVESLVGGQKSFRTPAHAVRIVAHSEGEGSDLYIITLDAKIYRISDVAGMMAGDGKRHKEVTPLSETFALDSRCNVLDVVAVGDPKSEALLAALLPESLYVIRRHGSQFSGKEFCLGRDLSCIAPRRAADGSSGVIIGTRDRSILVVSLEGTLDAEIYLPDVPIALHEVKTDTRRSELLVGFAKGSLHLYCQANVRYLEELNSRCGRYREYRKAWSGHNLGEKLVLLMLAGAEALTLSEIHARLDLRVSPLISRDFLRQAVGLLEKNGLVRVHGAGIEVAYAIQDQRYAEWVHATNQQLDVLNEHRKELIDSLRLEDVASIAKVLTENKQISWLIEFLLLDQQRWRGLVQLSSIANQRASADTDVAKQSARRAYLDSVCVRIQAAYTRTIGVTPDVTPLLSAFEIQVPGVKFRGFQRILAVVLSSSDTGDLSSAVSWIRNCSNRSEWQIILVLATQGKDFLLNVLRQKSAQIAVVDYQDLKRIFLSASPESEFLDILATQISFADLSPFQIRGPVKDMFYGRDSERQMILSGLLQPGGRGYAIIGPRRVGKTSLLLRLKQDIEEKSDAKTIFLDSSLYGGDVQAWCKAILEKLGIEGKAEGTGSFVRSIEVYCRHQGQNLVLFLDEVDSLLAADEQSDHVFSNTLRALISQADVKIIVAGYRVLYWQVHDLNSPHYNMLDPVTLKALDEKDAFELVEEPLRRVFSITRGDILHILDKTACYPNFIQFCCRELVQAAGRQGKREISLLDIDRVVLGKEFYGFIAGVYLANLKTLDERSLTLLYLMVAYYDPALRKIITDRQAYSNAARSQYAQARRKYEIGARFTPYDLHRLLELHSVSLNPQEVEALIRDLVLASILKAEADTRDYSFILPDLPSILKRHVEVELVTVNLLERVEEIFRRKSD